MLVSVIMPAYNAGSTIDESVASVLSQSYQDIELIIIDDGSTDSTLEKIKSLAESDARIRFVSQANSGKPSIARNKAFSLVKGNFVTFLDSDDLMDVRRIETLIQEVNQNPGFDVFFHDVYIINNEGKAENETYLSQADFLSRSKPYVDRVVGDAYMLKANFLEFMLVNYAAMHTSSVMFRRCMLDQHGLRFSEDLAICEDTEFWFSLANLGRVIYVNKPLSSYRDTPGSITKDQTLVLNDSLIMHSRSEKRYRAILNRHVQVKYLRKIANILSDIGYLKRKNGIRKDAVKSYCRSFKIWPRFGGAVDIVKAICWR